MKERGANRNKQKNKKCEKQITKLFSLGKMSFTGKFTNNFKTNIPKAYIELIMCNSCKLVQLDRNFNPKYLYDDNIVLYMDFQI